MTALTWLRAVPAAIRGSTTHHRTNTLLGATMAACLAASPLAAAKDLGPSKPFDFKAWDQYLGGGDSSQYSSLKQINKSNVAKLKVAWTYQIGQGPAPDFNPTVVGDTIYLLGAKNAIVALDAKTGKEIWSHPNQGLVGSRGINQWVSKNGKDRRLVYINNGNLTEIDAKTGETVTSFGKDGFVDLRVGLPGDISKMPPLRTNNPGRIYENLVIISLPANGASYVSNPADIHAYDVLTGELKWVFHTIPAEGEPGSETWPKGAPRAAVGGGHNWSESTIDETRGIIYIPTGTARYDFYGANRHGKNLYANCLLAIDAKTGKLKWYFQMVHHDIWDYDIPAAPKLITVMHDGKKVDAVAQPTKFGFLYVFDRDTGKPLWPVEERPVPKSDVPGEEAWPTQPFPTAPPPFERQKFTEDMINPYLAPADAAKAHKAFESYRNEGLFTPPSLRGSLMLPGHFGGGNWGCSAIDPKNGTMYVESRSLPTLARLTVPPKERAVVPNNADAEFVPYYAPIDFLLQSNGMSIIGPPWSRLTAYDLNKGTIKWQVPLGGVTGLEDQGIAGTGSHVPRGGPVVTGSGLIFISTASDRKLHAYDEETGKLVWEYSLPAAAQGVPAVYEAGGREYVAIAVGGNGMFGLRGTQKPGANQYMVFALPD
jgi:glucose dehydrogenase